MSLEIGRVLADRYRIDGLLGEGGMGAVYRAHDLRLNLTVAVKESLEDPSGRIHRSTDPTVRTQIERARERFQYEAQVLARLKHPNLPVVRDHFALPGEGQYLIMEYIEGQDLQVLLAQAGPLGEKRVAEIGTQVCEILEYLHSQDPPVIHRDIKPANLRVTPQGKITLVDFGICKEGIGQATKTAARAVSEGFSPPEMYHQRGKSDARSDIYSLGATLLALFTGEEIPSPTERVMGKSLPRTPARTGYGESKLVHVLYRAMELKAEDRYQSATEFQAALINASAHDKTRLPAADSMAVSPGETTRQPVSSSVGSETRVVARTGKPPDGNESTIEEESRRKSKAVAVTLAIIVGPWSWLYTVRRDRWKFIIACSMLSCFIVMLGLAAALGLLDHDPQGPEWLIAVPYFIGAFGYMITYLWSIAESLIRPREFYDQYQN